MERSQIIVTCAAAAVGAAACQWFARAGQKGGSNDEADLAIEMLFKTASKRWLTVDHIMQLSGVDPQRGISLYEWEEVMACQLKIPLSKQAIQAAFHKIDTLGNAVITREELHEALGRIQARQEKRMELRFRDQIGTERPPQTMLVAIIAHTAMQAIMLDFVAKHIHFFQGINVVTYAATARVLKKTLGVHCTATRCSGPLGGDQEIESLISRRKVAAVFFFRDPMSAHAHDADIAALSRIADVHDVIATYNSSSSDAVVHTLQTSLEHVEMMQQQSLMSSKSTVVLNYEAEQKKKLNSVISSRGRSLEGSRQGSRVVSREPSADGRSRSPSSDEESPREEREERAIAQTTRDKQLGDDLRRLIAEGERDGSLKLSTSQPLGASGLSRSESRSVVRTESRKLQRERSLARSDSNVTSSTLPSEEFAAAPPPKTQLVGIVAHNAMKSTMMEFVERHVDVFRGLSIVTTGTTGAALENTLGLRVAQKVSSGPLGGDQEIGSLISQGKVAALFFFRDPLTSHPHETDIIALGRIAGVHDVTVAFNPATGDAVVHALRTSAAHVERLRSRQHSVCGCGSKKEEEP